MFLNVWSSTGTWSTYQENCLSLDLHFKTLWATCIRQPFSYIISLLLTRELLLSVLISQTRLPTCIHNASGNRRQTWDQAPGPRPPSSPGALPLLFRRTLNTWIKVKQNDHDMKNRETKSCGKWRKAMEVLRPWEECSFKWHSGGPHDKGFRVKEEANIPCCSKQWSAVQTSIELRRVNFGLSFPTQPSNVKRGLRRTQTSLCQRCI